MGSSNRYQTKLEKLNLYQYVQTYFIVQKSYMFWLQIQPPRAHPCFYAYAW
jgi:hypothetical protein